jgi:hypothetical protein
MERRAHQSRLDDRPVVKRTDEILDSEVGEARPEGDVRPVGVLRLEAGQTADDLRDLAPMPLQQALAGERRTVQGARRDDARPVGSAQWK